MPEPTLFICYSRRDYDKVAEIVTALESRKLNYEVKNIFWDQKLRYTADWWKNILREIQGRTHFIYFLSEDSYESSFCIAEYDWAVKLDRCVINVQIGDLSKKILNSFTSNVMPLQVSAEAYAEAILREVAEQPNGNPLPHNLASLERPARPNHYFNSEFELVNKLTRNQSVYPSELRNALNRLLKAIDNPKYKADSIQLLEEVLKYADLSQDERTEVERAIKSNFESAMPLNPTHNHASTAHTDVVLDEEKIESIIDAALPKTMEEFVDFSARLSRVLTQSKIDLEELVKNFEIDAPQISPRIVAVEITSSPHILHDIILSRHELYRPLAGKLLDFCIFFLRKTRLDLLNYSTLDDSALEKT